MNIKNTVFTDSTNKNKVLKKSSFVKCFYIDEKKMFFDLNAFVNLLQQAVQLTSYLGYIELFQTHFLNS